MKKLIKIFIFLLLRLLVIFLFSFNQSFLLAQVSYDTAGTEVRTINEKKLDRFKSLEEFQYNEEEYVERENAFERFLANFLKKIFGASISKSAVGILKIAIYILAGAFIVFLIFKLLKVDKSWFFQKQDKAKSLEISLTEQNITEVNFNKEIREAIEQKQFKKAVRLFYLQMLRELHERKLIQWRIEKTNADYIKEIKSQELKAMFEDNARIYEYIWYGDFHISERVFEAAEASFNTFTQKVNSKV